VSPERDDASRRDVISIGVVVQDHPRARGESPSGWARIGPPRLVAFDDGFLDVSARCLEELRLDVRMVGPTHTTRPVRHEHQPAPTRPLPDEPAIRPVTSSSEERGHAAQEKPKKSRAASGARVRRVESWQRNGCGHAPTPAQAPDGPDKDEVGGSIPPSPTHSEAFTVERISRSPLSGEATTSTGEWLGRRSVGSQLGDPARGLADHRRDARRSPQARRSRGAAAASRRSWPQARPACRRVRARCPARAGDGHLRPRDRRMPKRRR